jgi:photosystem II stability/assembly factor-like uncharacterized protein
MRPGDEDVMLVTDGFAGVHRSVDGGKTWVVSNEGITDRTGISGDAIPAFCLTIDPNNPDIVWAGMQYLGGMYRSDDGGLTWEKRINGIDYLDREGLTWRGITVEPGNSNVVYIAGEISSWVWNNGQEVIGREFDKTMGVVYKTTDGGQTWKEVWKGDNLARYVWINPQDKDIIYISTGLFDREARNSDYESNKPGGEGILKSNDGGRTWKPMNEGLGNLYLGSVHMHPEDPDILIAGAANNTYRENGGIYMTRDGGASWEYKGGDHITSVEFAEANPNIIYAAGVDAFFRSDDGGESWINLTRTEGGWGAPGLGAGFPIDFQTDPRDPMRIFANNYGGGNFLSEDGGQTWVTASEGYTGADLASVSGDPGNPAIVYVNGRSGSFRSIDGGRTWLGIYSGDIGEGSRILVDPTIPGHIIAGDGAAGILVESYDWGMSYSLENDDSVELRNLDVAERNMAFQGITALAMAPSDPQKVIAGYGVNACQSWMEKYSCRWETLYSILISEDGGSTWEKVSGTALDGRTVMSIAIHPEDPNLAWAATTRGDGIFHSQDGGYSWEQLGSGLNGAWMVSIAIDPFRPEVMYAGSIGNGPYKSEDGGASWSRISGGIDPNETISDIVVDPQRPNVIYAGSMMSGVYVSEDGGGCWVKLNEGLRTRSVSALSLTADGETLYAATNGEGLFRLSTLSQEEIEAHSPVDVPVYEEIESVDAGINVDGSLKDWSDSEVLHADPVDAEEGFLELTNGYAFHTEDALYFAVEVLDPDAPFVQIDMYFEVDDGTRHISWEPGGGVGGWISDNSTGWEPIGCSNYSKFIFGDAFEGQVSFLDLETTDSASIYKVAVIAGEEGNRWEVDVWETRLDTPSLKSLMASEEGPKPEAPAVAPSETPVREETGEPPQEPGGGGLPCLGTMVLPLMIAAIGFAIGRRTDGAES